LAAWFCEGLKAGRMMGKAANVSRPTSGDIAMALNLPKFVGKQANARLSFSRE
jgi:hypothetical protein